MKSPLKLRVAFLLGWALHAAALSHDSAASQFLLAASAKEDPKKNKPVVVKVEDKIREVTKRHKTRLMNGIDKYRAEICYNMKEEFGRGFDTFKACHEFMKKTCQPGKDRTMDGDKQEVSSGEGFCKEYFHEAEKKAEADVAKMEADEAKAAAKVAPAPAPAQAPAPAAAKEAPAPAKEKKEAAPAPAPKAADKAKKAAAPAAASGSAPSPGPAGAPSGPAPGPFTPGKSGGKPYGKIEDDESYYYKKGGKDASRLHMDANMKLPTQGYWGKLIEHDDGKTMTDDWMAEFGPKSGQGNIAKICKDNPKNPWCIRKGYGRHLRSSGHAAVAQMLPFAIALVGFLSF